MNVTDKKYTKLHIMNFRLFFMKNTFEFRKNYEKNKKSSKRNNLVFTKNFRKIKNERFEYSRQNYL